MKTNRALLLLAIVGALCLPVAAQELARIRLDNPSALGLVITTEPPVNAGGGNAVKITTKWPTTICLAEVTGPDIDEARLIYSARVKTALQRAGAAKEAGAPSLPGSAYLEMWVHIAGGQYFSRGLDNQAQGTADWKPLQTPFFLQKGQKPTKVTLNLVISGTGTVWVDDVVLSKAPLK